MTSERQAYVYVQLPGTLQTVPAGLLKVQRTTEETPFIGRFRYGNRYLERPDAVALDPFRLPLGTDTYEFTTLKGIPGIVRDASPDAWGRRVIEYKLERSPENLEEIDYLLQGPQDGAGNLSFGLSLEPPAPRRPYNRTRQLADLVTAAEAIEAGKRIPLRLLEQVETGTSLGGARPKASLEEGKRLWLGKFPTETDCCNLQRVEYATLELARKCSLNVCRPRLQPVAGKDVLMLERFDRQHTKQRDQSGYLRFGFASALTVLDCEDSYFDRKRWSYVLLADKLRRWSVKPERDRIELFQRMVFNAAITNNDDHPRNHAVLCTEHGWRLAPAYDLMPTPVVSLERRDLALAVGAYGRTASIYNLLSECGRFGLSTAEACNHIDRIVDVVRGWREHFLKCGVSDKDIEYIAPAMLPLSFLSQKPPQP